jgi:ATP-dependent Clp protease ATP-binding subunit ClpA
MAQEGHTKYMFERFSTESVQALFFSRALAEQAASDEILPEHLIGGILRAAAPAVPYLGAERCQQVWQRLRLPVLVAQRPTPSREIPLSRAVQRLLNEAAFEADRLGHHLIRPHHLLLAVLISDCSAAAVLNECGLERGDLERGAAAAAAVDDRPVPYTARVIGRATNL